MDPSSTEVDPRLLEDIRAGTCVAFVGAGFSAAAGLPSWPDLVRAVARGLPLAERAEHRATLDRLLCTEQPGIQAQRELEMAAQLLFDTVGEERCRALLRDALRPERLPELMQRRLKHLLGIPFRAIVTTNFDPLLPGVPPDAMAYRRLLRGVHPGPWRESVLRAALGIASRTSTTRRIPCTGWASCCTGAACSGSIPRRTTTRSPGACWRRPSAKSRVPRAGCIDTWSP